MGKLQRVAGYYKCAEEATGLAELHNYINTTA